MKILSRFLLTFALLFISLSSSASELWTEQSHRVLEQDYNGDGHVDLVLSPVSFIPVGITPFLLIPHDTGFEAMVLISDGAGGYSLLRDADKAKIAALDYQYSDYQMVVGDISGDGLNDVLLQPGTEDKKLWLIQSEFGSSYNLFGYSSAELNNNFISSQNVKLSLSSTSVTLTSTSGAADTTVSVHQVNGRVVLGDSQTWVDGTQTTGGSTTNNQPLWDNNPTTTAGQVILPGSIAGKATVDVSGAARYNIPLALAPGVNGFQPHLSLNYNSNRAQGTMGKGWSLGGISSISRCPANIADNGAVRPVQLANSDQYCLDGHKLILVSGTQGAPNSVYRTVVDSFEKIERQSDYWIVYQRDNVINLRNS